MKNNTNKETGEKIQVSSKQKNKEKFQLKMKKILIGGRKVIPVKKGKLGKGQYSNY